MFIAFTCYHFGFFNFSFEFNLSLNSIFDKYAWLGFRILKPNLFYLENHQEQSNNERMFPFSILIGIIYLLLAFEWFISKYEGQDQYLRCSALLWNLEIQIAKIAYFCPSFLFQSLYLSLLSLTFHFLN